MICISIANKSFEQCRHILRGEECAELRLDLLDITANQLKKLCALKVKIVATCRQGKWSDDERMALLKTAILSGAAYIDLELEMPERMKQELISLAEENHCKVIISYHNYDLTPSPVELRSVIDRCREAGADIVKVACQVLDAKDSANLLYLYAVEKNIISFGLGIDGLVTRVAAPLLGAEFTYASADRDNKTGQGQVTGEEMRSLYRILGYDK